MYPSSFQPQNYFPQNWYPSLSIYDSTEIIAATMYVTRSHSRNGSIPRTASRNGHVKRTHEGTTER